jgi:hypothetical protein
MPFAVGGFHDDDPTEMLDSVPDRHPEPWEQPMPTRPLTTAAPVGSAERPARTPYMTPAPPQDTRYPDPVPARGSSGPARFQRGCLLLGIFALVAVGFALAPYVSLALIALAALVVRTISWTTESARERRYRRGRSRWYDGPLTAVTSPWYLLVAAGGTLLLLLSSALTAFVVGLVYQVFRLPAVPGLLLMGAVLAVSLWWGPGSRRIRVPTRRLLVRSTRWAWLGWAGIALLGVALVLCVFVLSTGGAAWDPQPGPPWRSGTMLGGLVG